jgi:hypothetical protein
VHNKRARGTRYKSVGVNKSYDRKTFRKRPLTWKPKRDSAFCPIVNASVELAVARLSSSRTYRASTDNSRLHRSSKARVVAGDEHESSIGYIYLPGVSFIHLLGGFISDRSVNRQLITPSAAEKCIFRDRECAGMRNLHSGIKRPLSSRVCQRYVYLRCNVTSTTESQSERRAPRDPRSQQRHDPASHKSSLRYLAVIM